MGRHVSSLRSRGVFATVLLVTLAACAARGQNDPDRRPNVVFLLVDDLGWRDLGFQGSLYYRSPRIDSLAEESVRFERAYSASRVCSPSRASIMTGLMPTRHGITTWIGDRSGEAWRRNGRHDSHLPPEYTRSLPRELPTLAEVFRDAGYSTFFAGKWHLGSEGSWPEDHGFDINVGGWDVGSPIGGFFAPWENPNLPSGPAGESLTLRLAEETASFIESAGDEPFFAFLSFYAVHGPIQTTRGLWAEHRDRAEGLGVDGERFVFDRRANVRIVQDCPIYAGMIETVDDAVGIVLDQLEASGVADRTIICLTSDNGGVSSGDAFSTSNVPLRGGKGMQWEGGIRVPAILRAPGIAPRSVGTPMHGADWMPTLAELAEIEADVDVDGVSLADTMRGTPACDRSLYFHYPHYGNQGGEPSSVVIEGRWKLIEYHEDGRVELYNLETDPGEGVDLHQDEPEVAAAMRADLRDWLDETGARMPRPDETFDAAKREALLTRLRENQRQSLERRHAGFVSPDYDPGNCWWGSIPPEDCDGAGE
ncbi:MAG: sulfatase [Planctomycetota bacterium]